MNMAQIDQAVSTRGRIRISKRNGWAAGVEGIAMGYCASYDSIKVGFLDADGNYTGEYTTVPRTMLELVEEATTEETSEQATATVQAMASKLTDEALSLAWMGTEGKPVTKELALVRGWLMDELNQRLGDDLFDEWLAGDDDGNSVNPIAYLTKCATSYDIKAGTPTRRIDVSEAQDAIVAHFRCGATIREYDTTDRNGTPLHVVVATAADQGTVYEFPATPATAPAASSPQTAAPECQITPPAPTGAYAAALKACRAKGAVHAPNDALMAGLCQDVVQILVGAVSPQLVWEGAMKKGLTAKQLLSLCHTDYVAVDDLQWI
ncbi:hypothetical protein QFZ63_001504 [Streptomyces sp. B3I7]|uniref:hypothetical protein n=1 Tax=Streptomyces sp. B3I7 TaxID=3042269 RepID=UPI00277D96ED|nr:hypothetical protein [Streptomyces sp. B3I7]MDQ0809790.1 hypothetical protein [Streptomyces sp. B3I7]